MFDLNKLEEQCPKCKGKGKIENTTCFHNRVIQNSILETMNKLDIIKEVPDQTVNTELFFCKDCCDRGKILTEEGKRFMQFVRFWQNTNY